ncbi:MAG TPA: hypothetical protein VJ508_18625, partial [Saprospiraceae bacterium]|nr:hypothetical protein [Saprospiraceae bacterium]
AFYNQMLPVDAAQCSMDSLEEATRINPDHSRTHTGWALYHMFFSWNWSAASHHLKLALAHQDSDQFFYHSTLLRAGGMYLVSTCHFDEAIAMYKKALKMEPMNIAIQLELARAYAYKRDYLVALETVESMIRSRPDFLPAFEAKGWILFSMGRQREGIEAFEYARHNATLPITALAGLAYAYARTSQSALAESTRLLLQSLYQDLPNHVSHLDLALAHLGALEYESMFDQLQKAAACKMPMLIFLEANPIWDEIKRFNAYRELKKTIFGEDQRPPL